MPNASATPELYESIVLAGVSSPGQVTLSGHDRDYGWDVKGSTAQEGASISRKSKDPIPFTASFYLVDGQDFEAWEAFLAVAQSTVEGAEPKALDIYHPDLARVGIKSVVLKKQHGAVHDEKGGETHALDFLEYFPPKKKGGSPKGSKSKDTSEGSTPDPNQAQLDKIEELTAEYQRTPWPAD